MSNTAEQKPIEKEIQPDVQSIADMLYTRIRLVNQSADEHDNCRKGIAYLLGVAQKSEALEVNKKNLETTIAGLEKELSAKGSNLKVVTSKKK